MTLQVDTSQGWTEVIIDSGGEWAAFEEAARILQTKLNIIFSDKANDAESSCLDFVYNNTALCLHYNLYMGVSIFPQLFTAAAKADNDAVLELAACLVAEMEDDS